MAPARPLVGPYYVVSYGLIGDRPVLQALVLAVLNAGMVVLVWRALRLVVSGRTALLAGAILAVVPNRASTRLWFVLGPNLLAVALLALGAVLLLRHRRALPAAVLFVAAISLYEGLAGVAVLVVAWWWLQDRVGRARCAATVLAPVVAATVAAWVVSPKRSGASPGPFTNVSSLGPAQLGAGFWGVEVLGIACTVVVLGVVAWCVATRLPSFRRPGQRLPGEVAAGGCLLVAGAGPFLVGGAPFAVRGIFDRNNLIPDLGSCLVIAAILAAVARQWPGAGRVATVAVLGVLAAGNIADVRDYRSAVTEGHTLVRAVLADIDPAVGNVVVTPPLDGGTGVAQFILDGDLTGALVLRHGRQWSSVSMPYRPPTCAELEARAAATGRPGFVYDRLDRKVRPLSDPSICAEG